MFLEVVCLLLAVRVVQVLGRATALQVYKQTQDVEKEGGLMILVSFVLHSTKICSSFVLL